MSSGQRMRKQLVINAADAVKTFENISFVTLNVFLLGSLDLKYPLVIRMFPRSPYWHVKLMAGRTTT